MWFVNTAVTVSPLLSAHISSALKYPDVRGTGLANGAQNVQCTCHVCSTSKCMIFNFFYMHSRRIHTYIHVWREPAQAWKKSRSTNTSTCAQQNVRMFGCWRQKSRQKIAIRPDKIEHCTMYAAKQSSARTKHMHSIMYMHAKTVQWAQSRTQNLCTRNIPYKQQLLSAAHQLLLLKYYLGHLTETQ